MMGASLAGSRRIVAAFAVAAALVCGALSTPVTAAPDDDAPKTFQFALQNGMQVLVVPDHRAPVVTQMLWFRVGSDDDPPGYSGLAHFFEHMMFRGTKTVPGSQFSQIIARNGGQDNAFTTHDYTAFYEQIAKDHLRLAMRLEADRMVNLDLSDANVRTERNVVLEERRMRVDNNPQSLMAEQMAAALFLSHPYGRPVIGWPEEIRRIGTVEARDFYLHHYAPNNATLVVAGDVTPEEVRAAAEAEFGKVPPRELVPRYEFAQPERLGPTRLTVSRADVKVPVFQRLYRVPSYAEAQPGEAEALDTFAQLLGGDTTAALYRELVVKRKIAIDAGASYDGFNRDDGTFGIYAVPRPGVSLAAVEKAADAVLAHYLANAPAADELNRAKTQLVASALYRRDSQFAMASTYGQALSIGLTINDVDAWPTRIKAVTADNLRKVAARDLILKESVTGYLRPGK